MKQLISLTAAVAASALLVAPSLKVRFLIEDLYVYYIPYIVLFGCAIIANVGAFETLHIRLRAMFVFLFALAGPVYASFVSGGVGGETLSTLLLNMSVGMVVVLYPWDEQGIHNLMRVIAIFGVIISINTILYFGSDEVIYENKDIREISYLQVSFAMGVGVICSTYLVIGALSPFSLVLFGLSWLGLAVGRGRGALLFCIAISVVYLLVAMNSKIARFSRRKKIIIVVLIISFIPVVVSQALKVSRIAEGLKRILFTIDVEADVGGRGQLANIAISRIMDNPVFGNGLGVYLDNPAGHPHNIILQWMVDGGLIAVVFLLCFLLLIGRSVVRSFSLSNERTINIVYGTTALWVYVWMNFMKSSDAYVSRELWILSSLPLACHCAILCTRGRAMRRHGARRRQRRPPPRIRPAVRSSPGRG